MPFELTGAQKRELRLALVSAFPSWNELRKLTSDQLDLNLAVIVAQSGNVEDNAFELIEWATAQGRTAELLIGARNQNPGNPKLEDVAASAGISSAPKLAKSALQKIVGGNTTFLDVAQWRAALTRAEWRVCRIDYSGKGIGTGFLVGPDLVLTNHHVVETLIAKKTAVANWSCRFDYKVLESGETISNGKSIPFAADWEVDSAPSSAVDELPDPKADPAENELDYALVRLAERAGEAPVGKGEQAEPRGWFALSTDAVDYATKHVIAILEHPLTLPMKLALGFEENLELHGADRRVRYKLPTEEGSSGSPVFDSDWNVIALHHSGDPRKKQPTYNEAIPIALIVARPKVAAALD
jgi:hypothetical protein